jgi:uncharacterized membrane protein YgcG
MGRAVARAVGLVLGFLLAVPVSAAQDFGSRAPGTHVYDRAGVLSRPQVADLERRASAVEGAGPPTVVYVRSAASDTAATGRTPAS